MLHIVPALITILPHFEMISLVKQYINIGFFMQVNCFEDEHSKMATDFSANEIALFRKIVSLYQVKLLVCIDLYHRCSVRNLVF